MAGWKRPGIPSATVRRFLPPSHRWHGQRTLNGLARSGRDVRLYSSLDETRTAEKLARHPSFTVVSEQIKARAGETSLETAISLQKAGLHTPAQQAIHLALPVLESKNLAFSMVDLLTEAKSFAAEGTGFTELGGEINAQIKRGDLLYVDVAKGYGTAAGFPCVV